METYNRVNGTTYKLARVLDRTGSQPQPEAAYIDERLNAEVVVEHKTIVWPPDHFKLHRSEHSVSRTIECMITPFLAPGRPYRLTFRDRMRGTTAELHDFAEAVGRYICEHIDRVNDGRMLRSRRVGREWSFHAESAHERDYDEPSTGLATVFSGAWRSFEELDNWRDGMPEMLARVLHRVESKFVSYSESRRILVIDPHGETRFLPNSEWSALLATVDVPQSIDEIWLSFHDYVTDLRCGWLHQSIWPMPGEQLVSGCGHSAEDTDILGTDDLLGA